MSDPIVGLMHAWLKENENALLEDFRAVLRFPSLEEDALPQAPFGKGNRDALDFMLGLSKDHQMTTTDLEGFIGWGEFGEGENMIMTLGHLDVVPVSPDWKHEPFGAEVDDGYVYSRGAVDDKGPTMAAFYAALALKECFPDLAVRFRCVFGCNEESGFKCVERYVETEESPTFGVAPDSGWPLFHAEKGIADFTVEAPLPTGEFELLEINGGQRPNIVIDQCLTRVRVADTCRAEVEEKIADSWDKNLTVTFEGDVLTVNAKGKAAHGAVPYYGDSAAIRALRFLSEIAPLSVQEHYRRLFSIPQTQGEGIGIEGADEISGNLSCNLGIIKTVDRHILFTLNVRYPVEWKGEDVKTRCEAKLAKIGNGYRLADFINSPSLYFPLEHPMVKIISDVYEDETGEKKSPGVMGGGTYARAIPNTVSIGTGWAGDGPAHENDERLKIEHLFKMSRIYAHILYRLALRAAEKE